MRVSVGQRQGSGVALGRHPESPYIVTSGRLRAPSSRPTAAPVWPMMSGRCARIRGGPWRRVRPVAQTIRVRLGAGTVQLPGGRWLNALVGLDQFTASRRARSDRSARASRHSMARQARRRDKTPRNRDRPAGTSIGYAAMTPRSLNGTVAPNRVVATGSSVIHSGRISVGCGSRQQVVVSAGTTATEGGPRRPARATDGVRSTT